MRKFSAIFVIPTIFFGCRSAVAGKNIRGNNATMMVSNQSFPTALDMWETAHGPQLIASYMNSTNRRVVLDNLLYEVNKIFVSNDDFNSTMRIVDEFQPVCASISPVTGLPVDATMTTPPRGMGVSPFFEAKTAAMNDEEKLRAFHVQRKCWKIPFSSTRQLCRNCL